MPAADSSLMARNLAAGVLVRGSISRLNSTSSVINEMFTDTNFCLAIAANKSKSRTTKASSVMIPIGCLQVAAISKH